MTDSTHIVTDEELLEKACKVIPGCQHEADEIDFDVALSYWVAQHIDSGRQYISEFLDAITDTAHRASAMHWLPMGGGTPAPGTAETGWMTLDEALGMYPDDWW